MSLIPKSRPFQWQPAKSSYAAQVKEDTWAEHKDAIIALHRQHRSMKDLINLLRVEHNIKVSYGQVRKRLARWRSMRSPRGNCGIGENPSPSPSPSPSPPPPPYCLFDDFCHVIERNFMGAMHVQNSLSMTVPGKRRRSTMDEENAEARQQVVCVKRRRAPGQSQIYDYFAHTKRNI